jgi:hypothetical protein
MFRLVFNSFIVMKTNPYLKTFQDHIIRVPVNLQKCLSFDMSPEDKKTLIDLTYKETRKFLFTQTRKPPRRFSAS